MPKFVSETIPIDDHAEIGAVQRGNNKYWYVRMYWKEGKQSSYKSLGLTYEKGLASSRLARKEGLKKYEEFLAKVSIGLSPTSTTEIGSITEEYFRTIEQQSIENDALLEKGKPAKWNVKGGNGFHSVYRTSQVASLIPYLQEFWKTLPNQDMASITWKQLEGFNDWMNLNYNLSPSRRAKCITQIRMIWRHGREKGYVNWIPDVSRPPQQLKERARRNLQEEEWERMREWALNQVKALRKDKYARQEQKDIAQQFFYWFQVISWTGVRPPNGSVIKNLLKWDSYVIVKRKGESEKRLFTRYGEKGHDYVATIHPRGWRYFDALMAFHKERGTFREGGYMFVHTHGKEGSYSVGDPIKNFYKQWTKMLKELGLNSPKGTPQNAKLVPYALRGYYITMRLRYGKVSIDKLAKACGTSAKIILQTYYDFSSEKEYDELTQGFEIEEDSPGLEIDDEGFLIPNELDRAMM